MYKRPFKINLFLISHKKSISTIKSYFSLIKKLERILIKLYRQNVFI